ncbi:MAG: ACT domain-containing protein [Synechococcales bacterium]|nr:ACT domain-containing protein [Synechococcales bacterium]
MRAEIRRQLTIALENYPGRLAAVSALMAKHQINIEALTLIDNVEQGVIRLVVSDPVTCKSILEEAGFYVIEAQVLVVDVMDRLGQLASMTQALADARINIDYAYGSSDRPGAPTRVVFKVSDINQAQTLLNGLED